MSGQHREKATTLWLYVLELENDNYHVGMTRNVDARFAKHRSGRGSQWTAHHKPLSVLRCADTGLTSDSEAATVEDALTVQTMEQFGRQRVSKTSFRWRCVITSYRPQVCATNFSPRYTG